MPMPMGTDRRTPSEQVVASVNGEHRAVFLHQALECEAAQIGRLAMRVEELRRSRRALPGGSLDHLAALVDAIQRAELAVMELEAADA